MTYCVSAVASAYFLTAGGNADTSTTRDAPAS
jgi:hypothetical protein